MYFQFAILINHAQALRYHRHHRFHSILVLRLGTLFSRLSLARTRLWLTWQRTARTVTGGPAPMLNLIARASASEHHVSRA